MPAITHVEVRMYTMGTGDCFALKFCSDKEVKFKMLIDAGVWSGSRERLQPYVEDLLLYLGNSVNVLVVTHEHKDHVHVFDVCGDLFTNAGFKTDEIRMAWTEDDSSKTVKKWKQNYGDQKKALGIVANTLKKVVNSYDYKNQFIENLYGLDILNARKNFTDAITTFSDLHSTADANNLYAGGLAGMEFVKRHIEKNVIRYFKPGDVISDLEGVEGVKIYVLGPPLLYEDISKEAGEGGGSYDHNKVLQQSGAFRAAVLKMNDSFEQNKLLPFNDDYIALDSNIVQEEYNKYDWRKIDFDWLYSAGSLALRMNSLTNNLSLVLAFEFEDSGKVLLFPGDAEYGSWASWHSIKWNETRKDGKPLSTEDLLNHTVFYKVAHHSSHNGTAKRLGLDLMLNKNLAAMITLDYNIIPPAWLSTMPNRGVLKDLLDKTKGRLMILNEEAIFYDFHKKEPISGKVKEAKTKMTKAEVNAFEKAFIKEKYYYQYTITI